MNSFIIQRSSLACLFPSYAKVLAPVVRHQDRAVHAVVVEQPAGQGFLVGPRVGEDDTEIVRGEAELVVGVGASIVSQANSSRASAAALARQVAAAGELRRQAEVVGQRLGGVGQLLLDLDPEGVEIEQGGETGRPRRTRSPTRRTAGPVPGRRRRARPARRRPARNRSG